MTDKATASISTAPPAEWSASQVICIPTLPAYDWSKLREPFAADDLEWRVQRSGLTNDKKPWAMVLAYVTNRAVQDRLDDVFGPANWRNEYRQGPDGGLLCGLSVRVGSEWVTKWDGAENTEVEKVKGGLSNAMKRAAVQWGIGRYLYNLKDNWAVFSDKGQHRDRIKASKDDRSPKSYKWDPPKLPDWALPKPPPPDLSDKAQKYKADVLKCDTIEDVKALTKRFDRLPKNEQAVLKADEQIIHYVRILREAAKPVPACAHAGDREPDDDGNEVCSDCGEVLP